MKKKDKTTSCRKKSSEDIGGVLVKLVSNKCSKQSRMKYSISSSGIQAKAKQTDHETPGAVTWRRTWIWMVLHGNDGVSALNSVIYTFTQLENLSSTLAVILYAFDSSDCVALSPDNVSLVCLKLKSAPLSWFVNPATCRLVMFSISHMLQTAPLSYGCSPRLTYWVVIHLLVTAYRDCSG